MCSESAYVISLIGTMEPSLVKFSTTPATCTAPTLCGHLIHKILHVAAGVKYFDAHNQAKPHFEAVTRRPMQAEGIAQWNFPKKLECGYVWLSMKFCGTDVSSCTL